MVANMMPLNIDLERDVHKRSHFLLGLSIGELDHPKQVIKEIGSGTLMTWSWKSHAITSATLFSLELYH